MPRKPAASAGWNPRAIARINARWRRGSTKRRSISPSSRSRTIDARARRPPRDASARILLVRSARRRWLGGSRPSISARASAAHLIAQPTSWRVAIASASERTLRARSVSPPRCSALARSTRTRARAQSSSSSSARATAPCNSLVAASTRPASRSSRPMCHSG